MFFKKLAELAICVCNIGIASSSQSDIEQCSKVNLEQGDIQSEQKFRRRSRFRQVCLTENELQLVKEQLGNETGNLNINYSRIMARLNSDYDPNSNTEYENANNRKPITKNDYQDDEDYSMLCAGSTYKCINVENEQQQSLKVCGLVTLSKIFDEKGSFSLLNTDTDDSSNSSKKN